jgi:hypothetical protein
MSYICKNKKYLLRGFMRWVVTRKDLDDYKKERLDRPCSEAIRKYYRGLLPKRKPMYDDEIKDLELIYRKQLVEATTGMEDIMPSVLFEMRAFIKLQEELAMVREKLDNLLAKKESKHD